MGRSGSPSYNPNHYVECTEEEWQKAFREGTLDEDVHRLEEIFQRMEPITGLQMFGVEENPQDAVIRPNEEIRRHEAERRLNRLNVAVVSEGEFDTWLNSNQEVLQKYAQFYDLTVREVRQHAKNFIAEKYLSQERARRKTM